jgi:hypothetical protein
MLMGSLFQIKNAVRAAHSLAAQQEASLSYDYLVTVIDTGKEFEAHFRGVGGFDNLQFYG